MTPRWAITPLDYRASLRAVKPLRFAPTPCGAGGLDRPSGPPRIGNYVMAGTHPTTQTHERIREGEDHADPGDSHPASRSRSDAIRACTTRSSPRHPHGSTRRPRSRSTAGRCPTCRAWRRTRSRSPAAHRHRRGSSSWTARIGPGSARDIAKGAISSRPQIPVLVGLNTLQHWLWSRIGAPATDRRTSHTPRQRRTPGPARRGRATSLGGTS